MVEQCSNVQTFRLLRYCTCHIIALYSPLVYTFFHSTFCNFLELPERVCTENTDQELEALLLAEQVKLLQQPRAFLYSFASQCPLNINLTATLCSLWSHGDLRTGADHHHHHHVCSRVAFQLPMLVIKMLLSRPWQ